MRSITASVGKDGENHPDDVFTIQMLLNHVDVQSGGPAPKLVVDGLVGPKTITAINTFQQKQLGFSDGLVEPGKITIQTLKGFFRTPEAFPDEMVAGPGGAPVAHRLVYRDVRLPGWKPAGDTVIEVDADTPIQWFFYSSISTVASTASPVRLKIMAHGRAGFVLFCNENLTLDNVTNLSALRGSFKAGVDLFACSVAFIGPGRSDGNVFCSRMAQTMDTYVRASTAAQRYTVGSAGQGLDFGQWEGTVLTYGPRGDVVNVEHAPKF